MSDARFQGNPEMTEVKNTRELYETVFYQDEPPFVDYYFEQKSTDTTAYVLRDGNTTAAMIHLNPYQAVFHSASGKEKIQTLHYIVAVATLPEYRHQGCMEKLLKKSLESLYEKGEPLAFLMPADPAIYTPYGFRYFYKGRKYRFSQGFFKDLPEKSLHIEICQEQDLEELAEFCNHKLASMCQLYMKRSIPYCRLLKQEQICQGGNLYLIRKGEGKTGRLAGYFAWVPSEEDTKKEDTKDVDDMGIIREALWEEEGIVEEIESPDPLIMGRILRLENFLELFDSREEQEYLLQVTDGQIAENNGTFLWKSGPEGSIVSRVDRTGGISLTVEELFQDLMGFTGESRFLQQALVKGAFIQEIV